MDFAVALLEMLSVRCQECHVAFKNPPWISRAVPGITRQWQPWKAGLAKRRFVGVMAVLQFWVLESLFCRDQGLSNLALLRTSFLLKQITVVSFHTS